LVDRRPTYRPSPPIVHKIRNVSTTWNITLLTIYHPFITPCVSIGKNIIMTNF